MSQTDMFEKRLLWVIQLILKNVDKKVWNIPKKQSSIDIQYYMIGWIFQKKLQNNSTGFLRDFAL